MTQQQEIVTGTLTPDQLRDFVQSLAGFLPLITGPITIEYGSGTNVDIEQMWKPTPIAPADFLSFIEQSEEQGAFRLGSGDLIVRNGPGNLNCTLCHESDVHFVSGDESIIRQVIGLCADRGLDLLWSSYPVKDRSEWQPINTRPELRPHDPRTVS